MCGIAGYSLRRGLASSIGRSRRRRCSPGSPSAAPTPSDTRTGRGTADVVVAQAADAARAAARRGSRARARRSSSSSTSATTPRATRRSRRTTTRSGTGRSSGSTTGSSSTTTSSSRDTRCARAEPRMTVDSEAIFALAAHSRHDPPCARGARRRRWRGLARPARAGSLLARARRRPAALARRAAADEVLFASTRARARDRRASYYGLTPAQAARCGRDASSSLRRRQRRQRARASAPTAATSRTDPAGRPRAGQERVLPRAARRVIASPTAASRLASAQRPVARDVHALLAQSLGGRGTGTSTRRPPRVEHPVDLPLGQQRGVRALAPPPSRRTSAAARALGERRRPASTARSSLSSPTGTSKPASRSAALSEPNVCQ